MTAESMEEKRRAAAADRIDWSDCELGACTCSGQQFLGGGEWTAGMLVIRRHRATRTSIDRATQLTCQSQMAGVYQEHLTSDSISPGTAATLWMATAVSRAAPSHPHRWCRNRGRALGAARLPVAAPAAEPPQASHLRPPSPPLAPEQAGRQGPPPSPQAMAACSSMHVLGHTALRKFKALATADEARCKGLN